MAFYEHQDSAAPADCLLFFDRPCLLAYDALFERIGVCPVDLFLFDLPVWLAVGTIGSASALPGMPQAVTNPARVGHASRTFLAWYGMELICTEGHTLLHVPGMPTSWFSTQRWLYLDRSWEFLFAGSGVG